MDRAAVYHLQYLEDGDGYWYDRGMEYRTVDRFFLGQIVKALPEDAAYGGAYTIPILRPGKCIELRVRMPGNRTRYLVLSRDFPELPIPRYHLFNVEDALPTSNERRVYLCEGAVDTMTVWQLGARAVGAPGAHLFQPQWCYLFADSEVHVVFDPDQAGQDGADMVIRQMRKVGLDPVNVKLPVPHGEDPSKWDINRMYMEQGEESLRRALRIP